MAEKVILTDKYQKPYMPITRGELVLDSSGNPAFTSESFLATTGHHGLLSASDKQKIDNITNTTYTLSGRLIKNDYQVVLTSDNNTESQATISSMVGASIITDKNNNETIKAGSAGLVPAPTNLNTFLKGDGTWSTITNSLTANKLSETQVFSFTATKSNYCKVVSINITSRYKGSSGLLRFYTNRSNQGTNKADSFDVFLHVYQQAALGKDPVLTFKSNNTGDGYDVIGILNISSTSTTFDLYVYGKGYTYHDLYVSLLQGNLTIQPETCDSLPTGTQITPIPMGNSQLLNGYKQGFTNGTIPIYIPFPGYSLLIQKKLLSEDYTTQNYPAEEFLKAICKWAIDEYKDKGSITLIGNVTPNSSGTCILHLYSSSGKKSDPDSPYDGLPRYCRGQYLNIAGHLYQFGTNNYVWSYGRFVQSTELTTSSQSKNVTAKGWYRIATSKSSILKCLGTFEIEGSVSGKHTVTTVQSGINYSENPFITVLNTSHFVNAAITKVRIVYHTTYTNNYAYLEVYKDTTTSTSLTIKLADGYGWSLCDITTGSVPTNYTYKEMPLDNATLSTTGRIITNGIKSTTGEFTGNVYSSAIYNGSKIYATKQEIIHADSNYFELNKGYPDSIMWFNASEYKFKIGSNVQFMIASNGNVGIGNVGGAPAYKLHVGDGEVMANTYHAWSGGFKKNGSSDSYVLLGGGGHKAISDFLLKTDFATQELSANLKTITKSIKLTKDWQYTGISINSTEFINGSGTYIVQVYVNNGEQGFWQSYFSGIMSIYTGVTNGSNPDDEIILHHASHACSKQIYLKTKPETGSKDHNKLYIACNTDCTATIDIVFKFKKLI